MKNKILPVKERPDLGRDVNSTAIINTDREAYQKAVEEYKIAKARAERAKAVEEDINNLKTELSEIKCLLKNLLEKV